MLVKLVCPVCREPLQQRAQAWHCETCKTTFNYHSGVLCFLEPEETLNETSFEEPQINSWTKSALLRDRIRHSKFLSLVNRLRIQISLSGRRDRIFINELKKRGGKSLILDVGCGGGRHYLCDYGKVIGLDPVLNLLRISKDIYDEVYQASALAMPFADNTFDYVVSSDVIGHIPNDVKDKLFFEMYRVLKPGGRTIHVIETDSTSGHFRRARERPEIFKRLFIDRPGHIGLELPSAVRNRFLKQGFKEIAMKRTSSNVFACGDFWGWFGEGYKERHWWMKYPLALDKILSRNFVIKECVNICLEPLAQLDDVFSPMDHANGLRVIFEK